MDSSFKNPEQMMARELGLDETRDLWEQLNNSDRGTYKPLVDLMKQRYRDLEEGIFKPSFFFNILLLIKYTCGQFFIKFSKR